MDTDPDLVPAITQLMEIIKEIPEGEEDMYEIELRLGWIEDAENGSGKSKFNPDVGSEFFSKIKDQLSNGKPNSEWKGWDSIGHSDYTDYYNNDSLRLTIDSKGNRSCMKKIRLINSTLTYEGCAFDVRISLSMEIPKDVDEFGEENKVNFSRQKNRDSFVTECWSFDLTTVISEDNDLETKKFEIELELNKVQWFLSNKYSNNVEWLAHSTLLKLRQLIYICEEPDPDSKPLMVIKDIIDKREPPQDPPTMKIQPVPKKIVKPKVVKPPKKITKKTEKSATKEKKKSKKEVS